MSLLPLLLLACGGTVEVENPPETPATPPAEAPAPEPEPEPAAEAPSTARLDLNATPEAAFVELVGKRMAHEFVEYRPYLSIRQFRKEMGKYVEADEITRFETLVYVPVDPDKSDAATLAQLPGLDQAAAKKLVEGRPYADRAAFLTALDAVVPEADRAAAHAMLVP